MRNKSSDGWTEGVTTVIDDAEKAMTECPKLVLTESAMNGAGNGSMSRQEDDAVELTEEQRKEAIDDAVKRLKAAMNLVEVAISAETRGSDIQIQQKCALMLTRKKEVEKLVSTTPEDAAILALFDWVIQLINADLLFLRVLNFFYLDV